MLQKVLDKSSEGIHGSVIPSGRVLIKVVDQLIQVALWDLSISFVEVGSHDVELLEGKSVKSMGILLTS